MENRELKDKFRQVVENRYLAYNSLFLNLPNENTRYTGIYIPLLQKLSMEGYEQGKEPTQIIEEFFDKISDANSHQEKIGLLFRMIQYIERQVLLFDCVEDAAFSQFNPTSLKDLVHSGQFGSDDYIAHFKQFSARLVFTAHPTQFYSSSVQGIMRALREAIGKDDIPHIDTLLKQLAFTPFINREKPTPFDEAQNIIYYMKHVYYDTIGELYHEIMQLLNSEPSFNPRLIELGFWPGGDRDGNPFVTAEITFKVARLLHQTIMQCYFSHLDDLCGKVSFRETLAPLLNLRDKMYGYLYEHRQEVDDVEILKVLSEIKSLVVEKYNGLYLSDIEDFMGRVHLFGKHFATLDIRQDSGVHTQVIAAIFHQEFNLDYQTLSDEQKYKYLTEKSLYLNPLEYEDALVRDTLQNVVQIREIQKLNGERGLHRYIISNTESVWDVLHVYALFRYCGYSVDEMKIDIVPLFETMKGMEASADVMKTLYTQPDYEKHLKNRSKEQTIMLGFSDGTKDGGYLKANWEIYRTKEQLTALSEKLGFQVVFFDGRGGPPARGGGKTFQFYAAQGKEIAGDKIQLTIQGQTITSIYGTHEQASYNVSQLLFAGSPKIREKNSLSAKQKSLLNELSEVSYTKYLSLKNHPLFTDYLQNMTTLKYYGETNIGSRPTKRKASDKLELKDLRAIPFVGAWSLARQNVPGFYGLGTAIESFINQLPSIESLYKESAFFRTLIHNSMMSMKKSFFPLTQYLKSDPVYGDFWKHLHEEYLLSKKWTLHLTGQKELMENELLTDMSINIREQIIMPSLTIQQYALQCIQNGLPDKEVYEKLIIRSVFGNINASRNSA